MFCLEMSIKYFGEEVEDRHLPFMGQVKEFVSPWQGTYDWSLPEQCSLTH